MTRIVRALALRVFLIKTRGHFLLQIDHVNEADAALVDRVVIVDGEKARQGMRADKAAFFIKWDGEGAVARADL